MISIRISAQGNQASCKRLATMYIDRIVMGLSIEFSQGDEVST